MLVSTYILPYKPRKIESQQIKNKKLELLTCIARHVASDNEYFNKISVYEYFNKISVYE